MAAKLYIGNRNYSSWSLRPWLALKWAGIEFTDEVRRLGPDQPGYGQARAAHILEVSPSGRVPALHVDDEIIYDSLAICEWAAERAPSLWPADATTRALARSAAAEMHSGFQGVRMNLPMNMKRLMVAPPALPEVAATDLERLFALWGGLRARFGRGGQFLFGARSIADAMFAPVASRLHTYAIVGPAPIKAYIDAIRADGAYQEWEAAARAELWAMPNADGLYA
jgi:glutathione S-transferase